MAQGENTVGGGSRKKLKGHIRGLEEAGKEQFLKWIEKREENKEDEIEEDISNQENPNPDMFDQAVNDTF